MDFVFRLSSYDSPALEAEALQAIEQRLEAHSRKTVPGLWSVTDKLNAYAAKGPGRERRAGRYRVYGVILIAVGIIVLVPGLTEPKLWDLICTGIFAIISGVIYLLLMGKRREKRPHPSSVESAGKIVERMRGLDFEKTPTEVHFESGGMAIAAEGREAEQITYDRIGGVFETEHTWLVTFDAQAGILLQKKDLIAGKAEDFAQCVQKQVNSAARQ